MNWYTAHIILHVVFKDGKQDKYPVWENIVLIKAQSEEEAWKKAEEIGRQGEGDSGGSFTWEERPSTWRFDGVRKIIKCRSMGVDPNAQPGDGTEVTYSEFQVDGSEALSRLVSGERVTITYEV